MFLPLRGFFSAFLPNIGARKTQERKRKRQGDEINVFVLWLPPSYMPSHVISSIFFFLFCPCFIFLFARIRCSRQRSSFLLVHYFLSLSLAISSSFECSTKCPWTLLLSWVMDVRSRVRLLSHASTIWDFVMSVTTTFRMSSNMLCQHDELVGGDKKK